MSAHDVNHGLDPSSGVGPANPGLVFQALNAHQLSAVLRGAIELDLFTAIAAGYRAAPELAHACDADARATRIICDFLTIHGFLIKRDDHYQLSPTSAVYLDRKSPKYLGGTAKFMNSPHLLDAFRDVAELARRGTTLLEHSGTIRDDYEGWVEFARSMAPMMASAAEFIGDLISQRKSGPIRVLDIAAGHGLFGIAIAKRNPEASIVALDWEKVLDVARENASQAGVEERFEFLAGDALKVAYGRGFDFILLTNFLHHFRRETCVEVMRKAVEALKPDGLAITLEFIPNDDRVTPPDAAAFGIMMLATTPEGDAYTFAEYQAMGEEAGLSRHELFDVPRSPQRVIISAR